MLIASQLIVEAELLLQRTVRRWFGRSRPGPPGPAAELTLEDAARRMDNAILGRAIAQWRNELARGENVDDNRARLAATCQVLRERETMELQEVKS